MKTLLMMNEKKEITEKEAWNKLSALCAKAEHCSGEMVRKMNLWGLDSTVQERIMDRLIAGKYVDDERYTRAFVNDKMTYNQWGRRKIEQALYQKGIPKDVSNRVLDEIPDEDYIAILRPLIHRKWKTVTGRNDYERSMKLIRFAMGRGFDIEQIKQCIDQADDWTDD